ncbi:hypothetical protein Aperf_G00000096687 [Anoplocephala perfoliata]
MVTCGENLDRTCRIYPTNHRQKAQNQVSNSSADSGCRVLVYWIIVELLKYGLKERIWGRELTLTMGKGEAIEAGKYWSEFCKLAGENHSRWAHSSVEISYYPHLFIHVSEAGQNKKAEILIKPLLVTTTENPSIPLKSAAQEQRAWWLARTMGKRSLNALDKVEMVAQDAFSKINLRRDICGSKELCTE